MEFSPWDFFIDFGLVATLLIIGTILRAKVTIVQKLFLPASIIAGFLGLLLGPNGFNILPFSDQIGTYPAILIAFIFGSIPLTTTFVNWKQIKDRVGSMWAFSQNSMILMWGLGLLFALLFIHPFWTDLNIGFGLILAAGFVGGHGTAAAVGDMLSKHGWEEATSLAMTSATVGVLAAIILGVFFIKIGSNKGYTSYLASFNDLPNELRTGLIPPQDRKNIQGESVSSISIDPLVLHFSIVIFIAMGGFYLSELGEKLFPAATIPAFSLAFIVGLFVQKTLSATTAEQYIDSRIISRISGSATDCLVAFGIASISITVVIDYIGPLLLLLLVGLIIAFLFFSVISKAYFPDIWFERGIFSWGWTTGTVAMGIALLRIVDPEAKSKTLDDYGLAYIPIAPIEVVLVTLGPLFVVQGKPYLFIGLTLLASLLIFWVSYKNNWLTFKTKNRSQQK